MVEQVMYTPPLDINFLWCPSDLEVVNPILETVRTNFARNKDRPFSRGLNIPLFFYSSNNAAQAPRDYPKSSARRTVSFVFTSVNTVGRKAWRRYLEEFPSIENYHIIPVALDNVGLSHGGSLAGLNCIRAYTWPAQDRELYAIVYLAHEIFRFGFRAICEAEPGLSSSITVFLSHAKAGDVGRLHSEMIKRFIEDTNMNQFFDATDISPGYQFDKEIEKHMARSTLLAVESDAYASRYWCQREILTAKQLDRPIVVVDCLDEYEDRIFPAASNVPCVHVSADTPISQRDILRVLSAAIIETIRHEHARQCLEAYRSLGWIPTDCELSSRPPEIRQILALQHDGKDSICYPEPPIYSTEADWLFKMGVNTFTPLWNPSQEDSLSGLNIGLSISGAPSDDFSEYHIHNDQLFRLSQDIARHLLARSATLIYGGDLRPGGFTQFILDEASALMDRLGEVKPHVENHLAWPLYLSDAEIVAWRAKYHHVMDTVEHGIPPDLVADLDENVFLPPTTPENMYIWSRCLTQMRERSVCTSNVRVCAGGRRFGYKGKMPGVLEEFCIALNAKKPIFLLGGFGGVVQDVCSLILEEKIPEALTEQWQLHNNQGYSELQHWAKDLGHAADYEEVFTSISSVSIAELSSRCGLDDFDYRRLMVTPYVEECVHLILKGLKFGLSKSSY